MGGPSNLDKLQAIVDRLTASEHSMLDAALAELSEDAVIVTDLVGRIIVVNKKAASIFGYELAELVGRIVEDLLVKGHREIHQSHRYQFWELPRARSMQEFRPVVGLKKDGSTVSVQIALVPLVGQGCAVAVLKVADD